MGPPIIFEPMLRSSLQHALSFIIGPGSGMLDWLLRHNPVHRLAGKPGKAGYVSQAVEILGLLKVVFGRST